MSVIGRKIGPGLEIADDRHVDQKAEDAGPGKVPEADGHQEVERPFMPKRYAGLAARYRDEVRSIEGEQGQRDDLERREGRRERHVELGLAGEVPVMSGANKAAAKNENDVEIDNPQSGHTLDQPELVKNDRDDDRDEQLEETFDPEMDYPEAPGIHDGVVGRPIKK